MRRVVPFLLAMPLLAVVACTSSTSGQGTSRSAPSTAASPATPTSTSAPSTAPASSTPPPSTSAAPPPDRARQQFDAMSEAARVGQLFMVDCPSTSLGSATVTAIQQYHVGAVILDGTSTAGAATTAGITHQLQALAPSAVKLFIATDQEGGLVQRLQGPGFDSIPSAVQQGGLDPATLTTDATQWGRELRAAGVNVNLAPVLDTVPAGWGSNPPIGDLDREYGSDPATVGVHGNAVIAGMRAAGIDTTVKHFPGLGRTRGNTDTTGGVTDTVTTANDPYLAPFAQAVRNHVPFVMMSTAVYARIDPDNPAAFSKRIVTGVLREQLGFTGIVISDDIGAAAQVRAYSIGDRAVKFIAAGGTMVLTVDATQAATMTQAVLAKAASDPAFKALVDSAALTVLRAKDAAHLLH